MSDEYDPPRSSWPWGLVPVAGAILGALAVFGVIGVTWLADPTVYLERGTPTDFYPSDASVLGGFALLGMPVGAICGAIIASLVCRVGIEIKDTFGFVPAAMVGGLLAGAAGTFVSVPLVWVVEAPPHSAFMVAAAAGISGVICAVGALRLRDRGAHRHSAAKSIP